MVIVADPSVPKQQIFMSERFWFVGCGLLVGDKS